MFKNLHPTITAGKRMVSSKDYGKLKSDQVDQFVKCKQCGFSVDSKRFAKGQGNGIRIDESGATPYPDIYAGCPFCGSMNY